MVRPIPIDTPEVAPNVVQQPQASGAGADALNRGLGAIDRGLAKVQADIEQRQKRDGELWAAKKLAEARAEWTKAAAEREIAADGEAAGYAAKMDADYGAYSEKALGEAPNRYAKERLEAGLVEMGGRLGANARVFEATRRVAHRGDLLTTTVSTEVNNVLSDGSLFAASLASVEGAIKAAGLPADAESKMLRRARSDLAEAHVRAMLRSDPEGALKGLTDGTWDAYLTPESKASLFNVARTDAGAAMGERIWKESRTGPGVYLGKGDLPPTLGRILAGTEAPNYSTLYNHAESGEFAGIDVSKMSLGEVLEFNKPGGRYAEWMKKQGHDVAPVGAGQIIHETLKAAAAELGLPPETPFTAETQNRIIMHLAQKRLKPGMSQGEKRAAMRAEWNGLAKATDAELDRAIAEVEGGTPKGGAFKVPITVSPSAKSKPRLDNLAPGVANSFRAMQDDFGRPIPIRGGTRTKAENDAVKGAKRSRHMHEYGGDALDLDLSKFSIEERKQIIMHAARHGFTGFGVGSNSLHIDKGPKRAWGYVRASGGGPVPEWARETVNAAHAGKFGAAPVAGSGPTRISDIPDPRVRAAADAAYRANEVRLNAERRNFMVGFDEELAFVAAGNDPPPDSKFTRENLVALFGPADGQALYDKRMRAVEDGHLWKDVRQMTPEDLVARRAVLAAEASDATALAEPGKHKEAVDRLATFDRFVAGRREAVAKDPAGYALTAMEGLKFAASKLEEKPSLYADLVLQGQMAMGISEPKILTNNMAAAMVKDIATTDDAMTGAKLNTMKEQWGEHWPQVLRELRAAGLSGGQFIAAVYADDPALSEEIIGATRAGVTELKKGMASDVTRDIETAIDDALQPYMVAHAAGKKPGDTIGQFNEVRDVMLAWALMQTRHGNGDAAEQAVKRFMEAKFLEPGNVARVSALVPREFNGKPMTDAAVEAVTDALLTDEAIKGFDPTMIGPAGPEAEWRTRSAAIRSGVWVSNDNNDGLVLMVPDAVSGALVPLRNRDGKFYEAPYGMIAEHDGDTAGIVSEWLLMMSPATAPLGAAMMLR